MVDVLVVVLVKLLHSPAAVALAVMDSHGDFVPALAKRAADKMVRSVEKRMFPKVY